MLEVGKTYKNKNGEEVHILSKVCMGNLDYFFVGEIVEDEEGVAGEAFILDEIGNHYDCIPNSNYAIDLEEKENKTC